MQRLRFSICNDTLMTVFTEAEEHRVGYEKDAGIDGDMTTLGQTR